MGVTTNNDEKADGSAKNKSARLYDQTIIYHN